MSNYDPKALEPKWQKIWDDTKLYEASDSDSRPKWYQLEFFPYPSGSTMHVGHVRNYVISDVAARYKRMTGHNVLHPMGWDAFGLPAENQAIKTGIAPRKSTEANIAVFKRQLAQVGLSYDWSREINSSEPDYYRWTQWLFLLFYERKLAYKAEAAVNWCPFDKTVLANEQVIKRDGVNICERCENTVEKRYLSQWFFKITEYADRLLNDLDDLDWSEPVKAMQRNWIGRSVGAEIEFAVEGSEPKITVFTTRADTLYGATYMVLAPEHELVEQITTPEHRQRIETYVKATQSKSEIERQDDTRSKTGTFTGAYARNPATGHKIPIWVADYVLGGYGTGAIMAVPAHDERDYAFARKFDLPITPVVAEVFNETDSPVRAGIEIVERRAVQCIVQHPTDDTYLLLKRKQWQGNIPSFVTGGIEPQETAVEAAVRELNEETGYVDVADARLTEYVYQPSFYHEVKQVNRRATMHTAVIKLASLKQEAISQEEQELQEPIWVKADHVLKHVFGEGCKKVFRSYLADGYCYGGEGVVINSDSYNGMSSAEARDTMTAAFGREKVNYRMRDWLISRQRYWGAPIPIIHCPKCGVVPVPQGQLPVELPELDSYQPSDDGRSPLARVTDWLKVDCPKCGGPAERETDTMDTFVDSSWYFLRFADPHSSQAPFTKEKVAQWLPVDSYVGGVEHAVAHLLFARFWTKVLQDAKLIDFTEPFKQLRNQGMIGGPDGRKMGKRYGNVVTPDDIISKGYGADSLRLYELFIGPYDQGVDWNPRGIDGTKRFLNRVWALVQDHLEAVAGGSSGHSGTEEALEAAVASATHKALKKVTIDLEQFGFNTAIAAMMELVNELYRLKTKLPLESPVWRGNLRLLVQMLAPFAPHITEELWQQLGGEGSVHVAPWPAFDAQLLRDEMMTIVLQVNGKLRAQMEVAAGMAEGEVKRQATENEHIMRHTKDKKVVKTIYVPGRLVNFVVK